MYDWVGLRPSLSIIMKILAHINKYKGTHNCGGETYIHELLQGLRSEGHEVRALTDKDSFKYGGIDVFDATRESVLYRWADVVITHLTKAGRALNMCNVYKKPLVHVFHNTFKKATVKPHHAIIYNSNWTRSAFDYANDSMVFYPPTQVARYKTEPYGDLITLFNCNENKGGEFLIELARENPQWNFCGVLGSYGKQIQGDLPNLKYYRNTDRVKSIFAETQLVLMPSKYESFGKVGIEAFCSGIPVIASNAQGLKESLGDAGIFSEITVEGFTNAIKYVMKDYHVISERCFERAEELEPNFEDVSYFIENYAKSYVNMS